MKFYNIVILEDEVGGEMRFQASVKEMPGLFAEGSDLKSVLVHLWDAISLWLEVNDEMDQKEFKKKNIFEADHQHLEDG